MWPVPSQDTINSGRYYLAILDDDFELLDIMKACPSWNVRIEVPPPPSPFLFQPPLGPFQHERWDFARQVRRSVGGGATDERERE